MDFDIGSLIAMIGGAYMKNRAQNKAFDQQKQAAQAAQMRQMQARDEAAAVAVRQAAQFAPEQRQVQQQQIQQDLTGQLDQQVAQPQITAQGVQVGATLPAGAGSTEYLTTKAKEQAKSTASLRELAALMGRIGSASELRRNEGVGMVDAGGEIGRIQTSANNTGGIDQIGIQGAGQPNIGALIAGEALSAYGANGMAMNGLQKKPPAAAPQITTGMFSRMDRGQPNWQ